ncbi:hypothetical protein [Saccharothrix sp. HUAS TT1]|uniref:hypothetical protein n=1 Tax=unclassified Saccharothrix TaxID=2593673 RepID=UPI00345C1FFD
MAIVPMQDAVPGDVASAAEYNKLIDNIQDLNSRTTTVETRTTHASTGNTALGTRVTTLETRTTDVSTGNAALGTRTTTLETRTTDVSTGNTALGTRVTTLETRTTDGTTGNTALGTRTTTLETNQGTRGANGTVYSEIGTLKSTTTHASTGNTALGTRVTSLETITGHATTGNTALGTRLSTVESATTNGTTGNSALGTRVSALEADVGTLETNQGVRGANGTVYAEIESLKASVGGDSYAPTTASDTLLYGDVISTHTRNECWWGEETSNGFTSLAATKSTKSFTATDLRVCFPAAATGSGAYTIKLYTGSNASSLTEVASFNVAANVTSAGIKHLTLSSIAIAAGDYVAIAFLGTGWTTAPKMSSTAVGTGAQHLINEVPLSLYKGSQTTLPSPLNLTDGTFTKSNQAFWFALA